MSKFINKILKESEENIDDFFKPKNLNSREEKFEKEKQEILDKIKIGLSKVKADYGNKNYHSESEKLFLELFSKLHVDKNYDEKYEGYYLKNDRNERICFFDLKYEELDVSNAYVWSVFETEFQWNYNKTRSFMKDMLNEHFKLNGFTPRFPLPSGTR